MHFPEEAFKSARLKIKSEESPDETVDPLSSEPPVKSLRQFFPDNDLNRINKILGRPSEFKNIVERSICSLSVKTVDEILQKVHGLSALEKLLLYLKLPTGKELPDPLKQPLNPLGSRVEISQTITWIKTHLCVDKETSLPKQDVYEEYTLYCSLHGIKPLSTADFGKVMKQVYPDVRPRRLGTRGNSRYCYSGMTKRAHLASPVLPSIPLSQHNSSSSSSSSHGVPENCSHDIVCTWASSVLGLQFKNLAELEDHILHNNLTPPKQNANILNGDAYTCSSKISKQAESPNVYKKQPLETDFKRKIEEDSSSSSKTPPDDRKGRKTKKGSGKKGKNDTDMKVESPPDSKKVKTETGDDKPQKLPIPRLPRIPKPDSMATGTTILGGVTVKKQKPLQPKPAEFFENGNSLEQEEELAKYFESERKPEDEPKIQSQLRMLLEKSSSTNGRGSGSIGPHQPSRAEKRVSFDKKSAPLQQQQLSSALIVPPSPNTQKKFSFVPISPISNVSISPFLSPRPKTVSSPLQQQKITTVKSPIINKSCSLLESMLLQSESGRSQSVPAPLLLPSPPPPSSSSYSSTGINYPLLVTDTPVPSEMLDFQDTTDCSTDFLAMGSSQQDEETIPPPSLIDADNLNQIFNIINDMELPQKGRSYSDTAASYSKGDPVVSAFPELSKSFSEAALTRPTPPPPPPPPPAPPSLNLDDELRLACHDSFDDFAREVTHIGSSVMPPDL